MPVETTDRAERLRQYRTMLVIGVILVIAWLVWSSRGALLPFAIGLIFSYVIAPLVNRVQMAIPNRGWLGRARRGIAVMIVYLSVLGLIVIAVATVGPRLVNETFDLVEGLPQYAETVREESNYWNRWYEETVPENVRVEIEAHLDEIGTVVAGAARSAIMATFGTIQRVFGFLAGLLLLPLWTFYILKDQRRGMDFFYNMFPPNIRPDVRNVVGIADRILGAYIRGQLLLGLAVGIVTFIGLYVLDVQYAVPLAVLAGIFEMVPILGPWISGTVAAIVVLATDPGKIWAIIILFVMIQQVENTFLVPKIQGDAVDLNPAIIMILLVVGGAVFGLLGVVVIVPAAAIARDVFIYVYGRLSEESNRIDATESSAGP
ncbi:MAG TPA: AI-2E family transporter [Thermomicrobiales bacterium]|nr:AI-2E family transporter [Thermomicrobiales bacterium]